MTDREERHRHYRSFFRIYDHPERPARIIEVIDTTSTAFLELSVAIQWVVAEEANRLGLVGKKLISVTSRMETEAEDRCAVALKWE